MRRTDAFRTPQHPSRFVYTPGATPNATPPGTPRETEKLRDAYDMLSPVKASKLKANISADPNIKSNVHFKIALILRSAYFGRLDASKEEAFIEAQTIIAFDPTHNLANYIFGLHALEAGNHSKAIFHLQQAAKLSNLPEPVPYDHSAEVLGLAGYQLAKIYISEKHYIAAAAWLVHALLAKSPEATREFLGNTFVPLDFTLPSDLCNTPNADRAEWRSTYALTQIIFVLVVAHQQKIGTDLEFASADWLKLLPEQEDTDFYNGAISERKKYSQDDDDFPHLATSHQTYLKDILEKAIANDPYIVYEVTTYCYHHGIISSELYGRILHYLTNTRDPDLINKINYGLFKVSLQNDSNKANDLFNSLIANHFNGFSLNELGVLIQDIEKRDHLYHDLFIGFYNSGQLTLALECLRRISPEFVNYDATIVTFFSNPEPDYQVYRLKQKVITYILANYLRESVRENSTMQQLTLVYDSNYSVSAQISAAILHCNDLLKNHLNNMQQIRQRRPFFYFFHDHFNFTNNFSKMQTLANQMRILAANQLVTHLTNNETAYTQLQQTACGIIATGIADEELRHICQQATAVLNNINTSTPQQQSQIPYAPKLPPHKRLDFDELSLAAPSAETPAAAAASTNTTTLTRSRSGSASTSSIPSGLASPIIHEPATSKFKH